MIEVPAGRRAAHAHRQEFPQQGGAVAGAREVVNDVHVMEPFAL